MESSDDSRSSAFYTSKCQGKVIFHTITRMHSSRMHTVRYMGLGGGGVIWKFGHAITLLVTYCIEIIRFTYSSFYVLNSCLRAQKSHWTCVKSKHVFDYLFVSSKDFFVVKFYLLAVPLLMIIDISRKYILTIHASVKCLLRIYL